MSRRAFTLIEVMAVIVLLGLMVGAVVWRMTDRMQRSSQDHAVGQLVYTDRMARLSARSAGDIVLRFDLDRQEVSRWDLRSETRRAAGHRASVPLKHDITQIMIPGEAEAIDAGVVEIPFARAGRSPSYAVKLESREGAVWVVFAGLTGEATMRYADDEVDNLFAVLSTGRPDAH